ncbi:hypothetical protein LX64_04422 [Chitinophaga skermanii]|uniref:Uncharacterized protein n=1 Tax=Chitinophaga skermanii TaxID=331697 RepID=A0A327Q5Z1_9BACT|nr:hypothetical protein [Chitinophaga skermanii]RAI99868.1 hypothetical protein LX64_04422 [Chitinophaga skermanii]
MGKAIKHIKSPGSPKNNPFTKALADKKRIADALCKNMPLKNLKDIKFVKPL